MIELSIIVPVYNVEHYLDQCITSILSQSFSNFELILINDGSTDNSLAICQKYQAIDKRIVLLSQANQGQMAATRNGVNHAKGEYVGFVDSDDWIDKDMYQDMMQNVKETNADIVCTNGIRILKHKKVPFCNRVKPGYYDEKAIKTELFASVLNNRDLYGNRGVQPSKCLKIFRLPIIKDVYTMVPSEVRLGEDMAGSYAAMAIAKSVSILDTSHKGYNYRLNNASVSWSYKENVFMQSMTLCNFLRNLPGLENNAEYQKDVCYEDCFFTINALFNEYLIDNQKHGQIKIDRLTAIVNNEQFQNAYKQIDIKTIKAPNKFLIRLLASRRVGWIRFIGGIMSLFRHFILYISQNFF